MNEAGSAYKHLFSQAVATKTNRTRFITAAMAFCSKYGFDGVSWGVGLAGQFDRPWRGKSGEHLQGTRHTPAALCKLLA